MDKWFRDKASLIFEESLNRMYPILEKYDIPRPEIQIKTMKARWGSCLKNKGINKSTTVYYLKDLLNINQNDIYTIGDNDNDYPMLKEFKGYYIGNPNQNIKDICIKGYNQVFELIKTL